MAIKAKKETEDLEIIQGINRLVTVLYSFSYLKTD